MRVFLSYGHRDASAFVERLRCDLEQAGFQLFHDIRDLHDAERFDAEIERGIDSAQVLLAVLSPHAVRRASDAANPDGRDSVCLNEIRFALLTRKPVVPVMIARCDPPLLINLHDHLDFVGWAQSPEIYRAQLARLLEALTAAAAGRRPAAPTPRPWDFEPYISTKTRGFQGRAWLFAELDRWARQEPSERVLLLVADPGFGKSSAMAALVRGAAATRVLAHHFCHADTPATLDPGRFVRNLAAQIADAQPEFAVAIRAPDIRELMRPDSSDADPASAFEAGVIAALATVSEPALPAFIVIDGLDEAVRGRPVPIPNLLAARLERLPRWVRVVATSRRDPAILDRLAAARIMAIEAQDPRNIADLQSYLETSLSAHAAQEDRTTEEPRAAVVAETLCNASAGSFLYAVQALQSIRRGELDPRAPEGLPRGIAGLYRSFFERSWPDAEAYRLIRPILEVILAAREPLSQTQIGEIVGEERAALKPMMDALSSYLTRLNGRVVLFHKTLADWLCDPEQGDGSYLVDVALGRARLLAYCRGWRNTDESYALAHYPAHLADAGLIDELWTLLQDGAFVRKKAERLDSFRVARDYARLARALANAGRGRDIARLLATEDQLRRDAIVTALTASGLAAPRLAAIARALPTGWWSVRACAGWRNASAARSSLRQAALQLAVATDSLDVLVAAAEDAQPVVRMAAVPHLYRLWDDRPALARQAFSALARRAVRRSGMVRSRAIEVLVGVSLAVLGRHYDDPEALAHLRAGWQEIARRIAGSPLTRGLAHGWVLAILVRTMKLVMARQPSYQPFNVAELEAALRRPVEIQRARVAIIEHLADPSRGHAGVLVLLTRSDLPFDVGVMLAAERTLIFHGAADPHGVLQTLEALHERGCLWFRQSVLYVFFHVLGRMRTVDDHVLGSFARIACETIESTHATLRTEAGVYELVPHMAWADAILARHRAVRGAQFIPRFFAAAMTADDMDFARRTIAAAQTLSFAYGHHHVALAALRPAVLRDDPRLRNPLVEALANIRLGDEGAVFRLLDTAGRPDLRERVAATAPTLKAADFSTWVDTFFNLLLVQSAAFRAEVVAAFRQAGESRDAAALFADLIARVLRSLGGEGSSRARS